MVEAAQFLADTESQLTRFYQVAYSILRSRQDAEDAVQQALMKAWAARSKAQPATFTHWAMRIVVNECRNIQRYRMRVVPSDTIGEDESVDFCASNIDLWDAVGALPDNLRIPFSLKYVARLTEQEVANSLHMPVSTVKNRLFRARKELRVALSDWEVTFE